MEWPDEPPSARTDLEEWVRQSRQSQGLPEHVEDFETLVRIIALLGLSPRLRNRDEAE
jgi:hypothetical protein